MVIQQALANRAVIPQEPVSSSCDLERTAKVKGLSTDVLHAFVVRAKAATYIGGGARSLSRRPSSHDLEYREGAFEYLDSYFGGSDFIGQEVVFFNSRPVWAMNYYGRILEPELINARETGQLLQESLSELYKQERFLGGFEYTTEAGAYVDTNEGGITSFVGKEWITRDNAKVYELVYHGGLIRD